MEAMDVVLKKEVTLKEGTTHTCLSDLEEGENWCQQIHWITICEKSPTQLMDVLRSIAGRTTPQRVSVPGMQCYTAVLPVDSLCRLVDEIMTLFAGTMHQVVIPTLRFVPASFMIWERISTLNSFIWKKAVSHGYGVMNLHRNFMVRQARNWAVHGPCYAEFVANTGLGSTLSEDGVKRYEGRLLRLHSGGYDVEHPPSIPLGDEMPVPLWTSSSYCNSRSCSDMLTGLGYTMTKPVPCKKVAKPKKQDKVVQEAVVRSPQVQDKLLAKAGASRGAKRGRSVSVGQDQGGAAGAAKAGRGRGRGRVARDQGGCVITTVPLEIGTARAMVKQIADLKAGIQQRDSDLARLRKVRDDLEKELSRAREDVSRQENVVAVYEARSREESRAVRREREQQYLETKEWRKQRDEWRAERREMLEMYEVLHAKHYELKGQFQVFQELGSDKERKEKKAKREKRM